jgi:hypothetical protein
MENQTNQSKNQNLLTSFREPMTENEVIEFQNEYAAMLIGSNQLKNEFRIDMESFFAALLENETQYVNFCLIQKNNGSFNDLSFMVHFSDNMQTSSVNDKLYFLTEKANQMYVLDEDNGSNTYQTKKDEFADSPSGLGAQISVATGVSNYTRIISYERKTVITYFFALLIELSDLNNLQDIKYFKWDMIKIKRMDESGNSDYYEEEEGRISFGVCAVYEDSAKAIKKTKSYDFGHLHP